jgi:hypothetical protein
MEPCSTAGAAESHGLIETHFPNAIRRPLICQEVGRWGTVKGNCSRL